MMSDEKYGISYIVSDLVLKTNPEIWKHVKQELVFRMTEKLIPDMIDDGNYHVLKFDIAQRRVDDIRSTEYALIVNHSLAQYKNIMIPKIEQIEYNGHKYERVCLHCGNKLIHDKRGSCSACGAPNGGYK